MHEKESQFISFIQSKPREVLKLDPKWPSVHAVPIDQVDLKSGDYVALSFSNYYIVALLPTSQFTMTPKRNKLTRTMCDSSAVYSRVPAFRCPEAYGSSSSDTMFIFIRVEDAAFIRASILAYRTKLDAQQRLLSALDKLTPQLNNVVAIDQLTEMVDEMSSTVETIEE